MGSNRKFMFLLSLFITLSFITLHCYAVSSLTSSQYITDPQTIVSPQQKFRLGFFSPGISTYRYVGIWYNNISEHTAVWVANRNNPLSDSLGVLRIADDGNLVVLNGQGNVIWTTSVRLSISNSTIAELTDSGNLVLRENFSNGTVIWQSFEHPSNTLLPTMNISKKQVLTSWRDTNSDPSTGSFTLELDPLNLPQIVISGVLDNRRYWRSGPWNNNIFIGVPGMYNASGNAVDVVRDNQEGTTYLTVHDFYKPLLGRHVLESDGLYVIKTWIEIKKEWTDIWHSRLSECDVYGKCGPFGSCDPLGSPICSCLRGFKPKFENEWGKGNWSSGCVRNTELQCQGTNETNRSNEADEFLKLERTKVPDFVNLWGVDTPDDCQKKCLNNCSCIAYSYDSNVGCMWWTGDLIDIQKFAQAGADLYLRVAYAELIGYADKKRVWKKVVAVSVPTGIGMVALTLCAYFILKWISKQRGRRGKDQKLHLFYMEDSYGNQSDSNFLGANPDLKIYDIQTLASATNNFSGANKLGHGGFGSVYKGILVDGKEIAVKRLSKSSGQGLKEFKNEVVVISKLQHKNLVRLLGCCYEREEKMLIYEYLPNKSLDALLFDPTKQAIFEWKIRFQIIEGISRGVLYLHRDSRLKVIHRDLKPSNILLDEGLIPKISDFGMARIFGGDELQANTRRVVGTYGYMAPEYAMEGRFSEKSDVFSFGVMLLEIVSGKRSSSFYHEELPLSLSAYAWKLWNENKTELLIDPILFSEPIFEPQILRCIHVGLLCVQECAVDRPIMKTTLSMLTSETATLPTPKQPAFTQRPIASSDSSSSQSNQPKCSINDATITTIQGR